MKPLEVKLMRWEKPKSFTFIYPNMEEISDVSFDDVVGKLPSRVQNGAQLVLDVIWYFLWTSPLIQMCCARLSRSTHSTS